MSNYENTEDRLQFSELERQLAAMDFSCMSDKGLVYEKTKARIAEQGHKRWKSQSKRIMVVAASFIMLGILVNQTTYAKDFIDRLIKLVVIGQSTVVQIEKNKSTDLSASGIQQQNSSSTEKDAGIMRVESLSELTGKLSFELKFPQYIPQGYIYDHAELYKNDDGSLSKDYVDLYYSSESTGKEIILQMRISDEDAAYVAVTDGELTEVDIHGNKGAVVDGKSIKWTNEKVSYQLSCKDSKDKEELIKMAKSID